MEAVDPARDDAEPTAEGKDPAMEAGDPVLIERDPAAYGAISTPFTGDRAGDAPISAKEAA
jgi:hypothetical protein